MALPAMLLSAAFLLLSGAATAANPAAECSCAVAVDTNAWCPVHDVGYVAGVTIKSKMIYEVLDAHGHTMDLSVYTCDACKKAIDTNGFCVAHRNGFVDRQVYFSRLTYELARGEITDPAHVSCGVCKRNTDSHGWCSACGVGIAGRFVLVDEQAYRHVARAIEILTAANAMAERCEGCAVAMVTDTECPRCRITYKDGKPVSPP